MILFIKIINLIVIISNHRFDIVYIKLNNIVYENINCF